MPAIVNTGFTLAVADPIGLTLGSDGTIAAGGLLDGSGPVNGPVSLLNLGTIAADLAGGVLSLGVDRLTNHGVLRAAEGALTVPATVALTNLSDGVLTGGAWEAAGAGTLNLLSGAIVTDNATITLDGPSSVINSGAGGQALETSLGTIAAAGVLNVLGGRDFQTAGGLEVDGALTLAGGLAFALNGVTVTAMGGVSGFGTLQPFVRDDGSIVAMGGLLALPDAPSVTGAGSLRAARGGVLGLLASGAYAQSIVNDGTVEAMNAGAAGTLTVGEAPYRGSGMFLIQGGFSPDSATTLDLMGTVSADVAFDTSYGQLILENPASFAGTLSGFADGDSIMLKNLGVSTVSLTGSGLTLSGAGGPMRTLSLDMGAMDYSGAVFSAAPSGGGTVITVTGAQPAACYRRGTRIGTPRGAVRVEDLRVGDTVTALFAGTAEVVWTGRRRVDCRRHPEPARVWPVRIAAHAFGQGAPHDDLWLSPDHALFLDSVLIPIKHLINGTTVARVRMASVIYHHVELAEHDVLMAEGLAAESYLENGDRSSFDNVPGPIALYPTFNPWRREALGCAPLVITGPGVEQARARLARGKRLPRLSARRAGGGEG